MNISQRGIELIKSFEGCILQSYDDFDDRIINEGDTVKGVLTIGWGNTESDCNIYKGMVITQQQADEMFINHLKRYVNEVQGLIDSGYIAFQVNQNQFDALVSFHYNTGSIRTLCQNHRDVDTVANKLLEYVNDCNGRRLLGLVRRRQAEHDLFVNNINFGIVQSESNQKVKELQTICCEYGYSIDVDGKWGSQTEAAVKRLPLAGLPYKTPALTKWVQLRIGALVDGVFGQDTYNEVIKFQRDHNLVQDGIVGFNTLKEMALC